MAKKAKRKATETKPPPAIVREHLTRLATDLRSLVERETRLRALRQTFAPTISPPVAQFVLAALAEFEAEGGKSLDRAFGLKRRGRPLSGADAGGYALAHEVYWRPPGVTFGEIARRHDMDTENGRRYLRRQLKRYEGRILENAKARLLEGKRGAT